MLLPIGLTRRKFQSIQVVRRLDSKKRNQTKLQLVVKEDHRQYTMTNGGWVVVVVPSDKQMNDSVVLGSILQIHVQVFFSTKAFIKSRIEKLKTEII